MPGITRVLQMVLAVLVAIAAQPAWAHHLMGGVMPSTFLQGLLSGLGHPIIRLDHFAAVIAVGCIAATQRKAVTALALFIAAMMAGVALHVRGVTVPASELLVALSVIALGAILSLRSNPGFPVAAGLFGIAGLINGYALGESIAGAEPTPLYAYLIGLAAIQLAIAATVMYCARALAGAHYMGTVTYVRFVGAIVIVVGLVAAGMQFAAST